MEAKDTVMDYKSIEQMQHTTEAGWVDKGRNIAETQAEISFKAAIGAMVDLLKNYYNFALECEEIKAQLKEWGIDGYG